MDAGTLVFLAVSFVLIVAYTAWNIASVRRKARFYRELGEILKRQQREEPPDDAKRPEPDDTALSS